MTLTRYLSLDHVPVSPVGDLRGVVDDVLEGLGQTRRVVLSVPQLFPALATVATTGSITTLPERLALIHAPRMGLATCQTPIALRHRRNMHDARMIWAMGLIREVLGTADRCLEAGTGIEPVYMDLQSSA